MPGITQHDKARQRARQRTAAGLAGACRWLVLLLGPLLGLVAVADEESPFSLGGFGTLGATRTNSREVSFVRDLSQPDGATNHWSGLVDSLLGVQAGLRLGPKLEGVVQAVSRYRYDQTFHPEITWAYLKYEPTPQLSLRAGRLGTEFFMQSDSRLVGYSYLTVRPPGDYFWYLPFASIEGGDAVLTVPLGEDVAHGKLFYGLSHEKVPLADRFWDLSGSKMAGGYVDYQSGPLTTRLSYANILFHHDLPLDSVLDALLPTVMARQSAAYLATAGRRSRYYALGMVYDQGPWQFQLMFNHIEQGSNAFQSSDAGYGLAGYRIGQVTPYVGYSWVHSKSRNTTLNPVVATIMADAHTDQRTTMLGARWDVVRNTALKVQWDHVTSKPDNIFPYRRETSAWNGKLDVFSLTLDFVF